MSRPARGLALLLVTALLLAPVVPFAAVGGAAAAPAGMSTIPDANVAADVPAGETIPLSAAELEGGVMASQHADSLSVTLTTADHASDVMDADSAVVSGDGMAVVLRDDVNSAGREVALDAGLLQQALGYRPNAIYGTHEDGSEWTATAEYVDGYLVFDVPHFSSNTVTFSGEVEIITDPATDGSRFSYDISSVDSATDPNVTITGRIATETDTVSRSALSNGDSFNPQLAGNTDPTNAEVTFTGNSQSGASYSILDQNGDGTADNGAFLWGGFDGDPITSSFEFTPTSDYVLQDVTVNYDSANGNDYGFTVDVYIAPSSTDTSEFTQGTRVASGYDPSFGSGSETINFDSEYEVSEGTTYEIQFVTSDGGAPGDYSYQQIKRDDSPSSTKFSSAYGSSTNALSAYGDLTFGATIPTTNPAVDIDGDGVTEASYTGTLSDGETVSRSLSDISLDDTAWTVSVGTQVDVSTTYTERTATVAPSVEINDGNWLNKTGTLATGDTVSLSGDETWLREGTNQVTVSLDDSGLSSDAPDMQADVYLSHEAADKISVTYQSSTFEEAYNISHTYADATENAQVTIPFASERVVSVGTVEYRVDGGSWASVTPANYRLDGTTLDVYLDDATGGVEAGQTVDVRAAGRKISVENGKVTVTDPTAPGEELDTELRVDERTPDFAVNVGPTDDGDRVHYAYSPYFPTEDYVVIQANGDQDLYLPNAVTGDRVRVRHLDTRVVAERGDVRIDVVEAGENPELDVSPGPGGAGDPVTVEYYNTETGVKYLLNSLTRSIVVDSDVAESPAIFEDDDSEDTWAILTDAGPSGTSSSSGAVGQFTERASGAVGSISLPIDGSGLGQFALVGVLGLGGLLVLRRVNPFGGSSDSAAVTSSTSTGSASGSTLDRLTGLASTAGAVGSRAAQTTGTGLLAALRRLLAYFGQVATVILGNRRASITAGVVAAIVAARVGLVSLPEGTGILIVVAGVPVATWLILRQNNAASTRVWLGSTLAAVILGLEFVAPGTVQTAIEQLTSETVAPLLILVAAGGLYLWYRARQSDRPQIIIGGDSE